MECLKLEIKLESATSPGSGEGWAGMIDSDIVFDEFGLPYIPARRIKGILREMATDVVFAFLHSLGPANSPFKFKDVKTLFGDPGQDRETALFFQNAYLQDYAALRHWLDWGRIVAPTLVTQNNVVAAFTGTRAQTRIENGLAAEHSLRQTRVLLRGFTFVSEIEFGHSDGNLKRLLALAVHMTCSLGGKRNRGLGYVSCKLLDAKNQQIKALDHYKSELLIHKGGDDGNPIKTS